MGISERESLRRIPRPFPVKAARLPLSGVPLFSALKDSNLHSFAKGLLLLSVFLRSGTLKTMNPVILEIVSEEREKQPPALFSILVLRCPAATTSITLS
jgi:hypothetical protein